MAKVLNRHINQEDIWGQTRLWKDLLCHQGNANQNEVSLHPYTNSLNSEPWHHQLRGRMWEHFELLVRVQKDWHVERLWKFLTKLNILFLYNPEVGSFMLPSRSWKLMPAWKPAQGYLSLSLPLSLSIIVKIQKQPYPPPGEWISKPWFAQTMEYY